jgi:hypothetical protein
MTRRIFLALLFLTVMSGVAASGQELSIIKLPAPQTDGGKPLMQALKLRHSAWEFGAEKLPLQVVANLLWAA